MGKKDKNKQQETMPRPAKISTSWRMINPTGIVPVSRPSANIQFAPIVMNMTLNVNGGKSEDRYYDGSDYDMDEYSE